MGAGEMSILPPPIDCNIRTLRSRPLGRNPAAIFSKTVQGFGRSTQKTEFLSAIDRL
jgi:hypothetical protein